jgi:hypothetical protein
VPPSAEANSSTRRLFSTNSGWYRTSAIVTVHRPLLGVVDGGSIR